MKNLIAYLLTFTLIYSPLLTHADPTDGTSATDATAATESISKNYPSAREFRKDFGNVVYSIEHLDNVYNDLDLMDAAAGKGEDKKVAAVIKSRLDAGLDLLAAIMIDRNLPKEERKDMYSKLQAARGDVWNTQWRQHGEDKIKVDHNFTNVDQGVAIGKEYVSTIMDIFLLKVFWPMRTQNHTWTMTGFYKNWTTRYSERINRLELGEASVDKIADFVSTTFPELPEGKGAREVVRLAIHDDIGKISLPIRQNRYLAQKAAAIGVGVTAALAIPMPLFDYVGWMMDGSVNHSLLLSSFVTATTLSIIASWKYKNASGTMIEKMKRVLQMVDNPALPYGFEEGPKKSLFERIKGISKQVQDAATRKSGSKSAALKCSGALN